MKHTLRLTLPKLCMGLFLGSMFVVGTTPSITQAFSSTTSSVQEDDDEEKKEKKSNSRVPKPAEATGDEGVSAGDKCISISGKDIDGAKFELSDYEGKVVMLDFWGDW